MRKQSVASLASRDAVLSRSQVLTRQHLYLIAPRGKQQQYLVNIRYQRKC